MLLNFCVIAAIVFVPVTMYFIDKSIDKAFRKLDERVAEVKELIAKYDL